MNLFQEFLSFGTWKTPFTFLSTPSKHPSYKSLLNSIQGVNRNFLAPLTPPPDRSDSTQGFHVRASSELSAQAQAEGLAKVSGRSQSQAVQAGESQRVGRQVPLGPALSRPVGMAGELHFTS
jgi:hypothetical protein